MVKKINSDEDLKIYENEKHFKVFAGPGAGKTYLIIENIKHMIFEKFCVLLIQTLQSTK